MVENVEICDFYLAFGCMRNSRYKRQSWVIYNEYNAETAGDSRLEFRIVEE